MEGEGTLSGVSCTRLHDHCDLTCTFSLLRREGQKDLCVLKQRMAEKKAVNVELPAQNELPRQFKLSASLMSYDTGPLIPRGALAPNL